MRVLYHGQHETGVTVARTYGGMTVRVILTAVWEGITAIGYTLSVRTTHKGQNDGINFQLENVSPCGLQDGIKFIASMFGADDAKSIQLCLAKISPAIENVILPDIAE
jgi:hypothetical protein